MKPAIAAAPFLILLTSCTPASIEPFYLEQDLVRDPGLPGVWCSATGAETIRIVPAEGLSYVFTHRPESGAPAAFTAHLFQLGNQRFLDLFPRDTGPRSNDLRELAYVPAHMLFRCDRDGDTLRICPLDSEWMKAELDQGVSLQNRLLDNVVLTGNTRRIQALLSRTENDPDAFTYWSEWSRSKALERKPSSN